MSALSITAFSISASFTFKFSIVALTASKSSIVALPAINSSTIILYASNSLTLILSATTVSNTPICSVTVSTTLSTRLPLADGAVTFPVTVALWSLIITVTRSPSSISVVVSVGVSKSEPSILTYLPSLACTMVAYTIPSFGFSLLPFVTLTNSDIMSYDNPI